MKTNKKYYLYTMDLNMLNILSIVILIICGIITFGLVYLFNINIDFNEKDMALLMILMIPYFILHEILHSIGYVVNGADFKNISYGAHIEKGVLCCLVKQNVNKRNIMWSLMYPFIFIGIITYIIGLIINSELLIILSVMNISGAAGDLMMFFGFMKVKDFEYSEYDDPTSFAFYGDKHLENIKMFGLKYLGVADKLDRTTNKKVEVSKISAIIILIFIVVGLIEYIAL